MDTRLHGNESARVQHAQCVPVRHTLTYRLDFAQSLTEACWGYDKRAWLDSVSDAYRLGVGGRCNLVRGGRLNEWAREIAKPNNCIN